MGRSRSSGRRALPALVAAYLFVFQLVFGSLVLVSGAKDAANLDIFGNPLCITHSDTGGNDSQKDGKQPFYCCTQACAMFAQVLPAQSASHYILKQFALLGDVAMPERALKVVMRPETEPGKPRAPPFTG